MGVEVELVFAEYSRANQVQQVSRHIEAPANRRPDALVVAPGTVDGNEGLAKEALRAGIGWVVLHSSPFYLEYLSEEYPKLPIACVVNDEARVGGIQAEQFRAILPQWRPRD
jgi:ABC-type sugar transport system substrate-binding protein